MRLGIRTRKFWTTRPLILHVVCFAEFLRCQLCVGSAKVIDQRMEGDNYSVCVYSVCVCDVCVKIEV